MSSCHWLSSAGFTGLPGQTGRPGVEGMKGEKGDKGMAGSTGISEPIKAPLTQDGEYNFTPFFADTSHSHHVPSKCYMYMFFLDCMDSFGSGDLRAVNLEVIQRRNRVSRNDCQTACWNNNACVR